MRPAKGALCSLFRSTARVPPSVLTRLKGGRAAALSEATCQAGFVEIQELRSAQSAGSRLDTQLRPQRCDRCQTCLRAKATPRHRRRAQQSAAASSLSRRTVELIKLVSARFTEFLQGILDVQIGPAANFLCCQILALVRLNNICDCVVCGLNDLLRCV